MTRLTFVCHAATAATRAAAFPGDEPLDAAAATRAAAMAGSLRRADRAWSSPALRARQTAQALGLAATPDADLRDCDYGRWAGRPLAEVEIAEPEAVAAWIRDPDSAPHGGETLADLIRRVAGWLDRQGDEKGHGIVVTHASVVRAAILHAIQAPPPSFWRIDVGPLSRTILSGSGGGAWRLHAIEPAESRNPGSIAGRLT